MGSPCLMPLEGTMWPLGLPLTKILKDTVRMQPMTSLMNFERNLYLLKVSLIKSHSNLSYAFSMSNFKAAGQALFFLLSLMECIASWASMELSEMHLPESRLKRTNNTVKNRFQSIGYHFGCGFINHIAEANWHVVMHRYRLLCLGIRATNV